MHHAHTTWEPTTTRAFIVGLAQFAGDAKPTWSLTERLDGPFADLLRERGVPAENIVLLQDDGATNDAIADQFPAFLAKAKPNELLLFYFGSHGSLDGDGAFRFSSYDGYVAGGWILDAIEADFGGARALLFADSCHAGALGLEAAAMGGKVPYAVLGSTFPSQVAWSAWRFVDCMMRGFGGDARADLDGDGRVSLHEFAHYTARHMAFVAEGRPTFWAHPDFGPLVLSQVGTPRKDARVGSYVEVASGDAWYRAEVLDVDGVRLYVHYTDYPATDDAWVEPARVRLPTHPHFPPGTRVELKASGSGKWYPGVVRETADYLHLGHYDGYGPETDEWFGPSRIRRLGGA